MAQETRPSSDGPGQRWAWGLFVSVLIFGLLAYGLSLRPTHTSVATVELGGILHVDSLGRVQFAPFEGANEVEYFYSNVLFRANKGLGNQCSANAMYSPDG